MQSWRVASSAKNTKRIIQTGDYVDCEHLRWWQQTNIWLNSHTHTKLQLNGIFLSCFHLMCLILATLKCRIFAAVLNTKCNTTGFNYRTRQWTHAMLLLLSDGLQGWEQMKRVWQRVYSFFPSFGGKTLSWSKGELNKAISIPPSHRLITAASILATSADNNHTRCCWRILLFFFKYESKLLFKHSSGK